VTEIEGRDPAGASPRDLRPIALALAAIGLVYLYLVAPSPSTTPPCPTLRLLGLRCPGCGSLRAVHHLLHLRFARAFALNPLATLALPFLAIALIWPRRPDRPDWRVRYPRAFSALCLATGAGLVAYWAARLAFGF
jgi:Protein of unknown function (DUF2752)